MPDDLDNLVRDLRDLTAGLKNQRTLNKVGLAGTRKIKKRTRSGVDYLGNTFAEYSESHAKRRAAKGLPTSKVNLKFELYDSMLDYLDHEVSSSLDQVTILVDDDEKEEIAKYHNKEGAGKSKVIREFMGLTEDDEKEIAELIGEDIDELLNDTNLL